MKKDILPELKTDLIYIISTIEKFVKPALRAGAESDYNDSLTGHAANRAKELLLKRLDEIKKMNPDDFSNPLDVKEIDDKSELRILQWAYEGAAQKYISRQP